MGETTKNSTPQTSTIEAEFQYQNPDVTAAAESLTLEEKLLPLIEMLTSNDEELKITPPARRRSGIRVRETQRTVLSTLPEQQELSKSQEGLNQFPITESISFSTSPPFLNEPQTSAQNSTENNKQQQEEEEKQKQRSLSSPETPSPLPNITHTSTNIRHSSSSPPPPSFSNQSSNQVNVQTTTTTTTVPSTRRLQSSVRLSYRKSVDVLKSSSKIYTALFSSSSSSSSSSSNNSSNVDDDDRWDIDTPPLGFDNFKLRRTLSDLLEFLFSDKEMDIVLALCEFADKNVNYADGIASCLICIYSSFGRQLDLIRAVIEREILHSDMATTLLRRNTVAVKIISLFVKNVGSNYLRRTLAPICYQIALAKDEQLEVDPLVLRNLVPDDKVEQVRLRNMETLRKRCEQILEAIMNSLGCCPGSFRFICSELKRTVQERFRDDVWRQAVAGFLFLRFFCSALVTPENYNLLSPPIPSDVRRKLILIAKVIQNIASGSSFTGKETYLTEMNSFVFQHSSSMRAFYDKLATVPTLIPVVIQPKIAKISIYKALLELQCFISLRKAKVIKTVEESQRLDEDVLRIVNKIDILSSILEQHNFLGEILQLDPSFSFSDFTASPRKTIPIDGKEFVPTNEKHWKREYRLPHPDDIWILNIWSDETFETKTKSEDTTDKKKNRGKMANEFVISLIEKLLELERKYKRGSNGFDISILQQDPIFVEFQNMTAHLQKLDLKHLSHIEKKVFFINIYNLLMMHIHLLIGPPSTKFKRSIYFKSFSYNIDKHNYSLDDIKNGILRGNAHDNEGKRHFKKKDPRRAHVLPLDPRIHFCLTTFSKDSPRFRLFFTDHVDEQIDDATQEYCNSFVSVSVPLKKVTLPKVFRWYSEDFHIFLPTALHSFRSTRSNAHKRRSTSSINSEHSRGSSDSNSDSNSSLNIIQTTASLNVPGESTESASTSHNQGVEESAVQSGKDNQQFLKLLRQFITHPQKSEDLQQLSEQKNLKLSIQFSNFSWEPTYWTSNYEPPNISNITTASRQLLTVSQENVLENDALTTN